MIEERVEAPPTGVVGAGPGRARLGIGDHAVRLPALRVGPPRARRRRRPRVPAAVASSASTCCSSASASAIVSTTSVEADVAWGSFIRIGIGARRSRCACPFLIDRFLLRRHVIRFPWRSHEKKTRLEIAYLFAVPFLGWLILPFYFIRSGAYQNWPHITDLSELIRFFIGVNAVGTWDELFFICTCFVLLRRHFPLWQANLLQAIIFVSFLWELGYRAWGPLLTFPFALLQGWLFAKTRSLGYVLAVHLLFDAIVFLAIVHAHNPDWIPIFIY